jgi:hypothetical protein
MGLKEIVVGNKNKMFYLVVGNGEEGLGVHSQNHVTDSQFSLKSFIL